MPTQSQVFQPKNLLSLKYYFAKQGGPNVHAITAPAGANFMRASLVGQGGTGIGTVGAGGAFARSVIAVSPGDAFSLHLGFALYDSGDNARTWLESEPSNTLLVEAGYATGATPGSIAASAGDVKRAGTASAGAGDESDTIERGFGELGRWAYAAQAAAGPGGGGFSGLTPYGGSHTWMRGSGAACIEFYRTNPGY